MAESADAGEGPSKASHASELSLQAGLDQLAMLQLQLSQLNMPLEASVHRSGVD